MSTKTKKPAVETATKKPALKKANNPVTEKPGKPRSGVDLKLGSGKIITVPAPRIIQNGCTRPTPTWGDGRPKITFRVWQVADELAVKLKRPPTRQEMLTAIGELNPTLPANEQLTYSVFQNQFYRWRKFNGLFGRTRLDGKLAAVTGGATKAAAVKPAVATKPAVKKKVIAAKLAVKKKPVAKPAPKPAPKPAVPAPAPVPAVASEPASPAIG